MVKRKTEREKQKKWPPRILIEVSKEDIDEGMCGLPNKCMIKLAVKRAIGGHGYVKVESSGIAITRRDDFRERAFLPRPAQRAMVAFDNKEPVRPFSFWLHFMKTSRIEKRDPDKVNATRQKRKATGWKQPKYVRSVGLAA